MSNILEIKNLTVSYGGIEAVKGIDMTVPEGQIVTLIGANGAGKSTTLKSISGLVKPKQASILYNGQEIVGKTPDQIRDMAYQMAGQRGINLEQFAQRMGIPLPR